MRRYLIFIAIAFLISCGSSSINISQFRNQQYGALYSDEEKVQFTLAKAEKNFKLGKARVNNELFKKAEKEYNFLITHYDHKKSKLRLVEIDQFYKDHKKFYLDLAKKSLKKNWIFTTAGYYRKLQKLFPKDPNALAYLHKYRTEIKKRLKFNLDQGYKYAESKQYNKAKRCFNRVLTFNPQSTLATGGLEKIKRLIETDRKQKLLAIAKKKKRKIKKKTTTNVIKTNISAIEKKEKNINNTKPEPQEEPIEKLSPIEMEKIYIAGITSYENKDFIKAYEFFESLKDSLYKDTSLYLERTQDKIDALGLDE